MLFGNHHVPATFQRRLIHESLEGRRLLTVNDLVITGTSGNDTLVVTATGADSGSYSLNGAVSVSFSGLTRLTFNAGSGNDTLTINNPAGALLAPSGGIDYNGGGNTGDALNLLGGGGVGVTQTYFVGATTPSIGSGPGSNGDGLIRFTGTSAVDIRFTGLAPIVDTVAAASLTVNATDAANTISITNGTVPRLIVAVDAFEPIEFDNKGLLVVNGGDGVAGGDVADNILLNFSNLPVGLTGITINADDGVDAVSLQSSANVAVTINGGAGLDVISVGNSGTTGNPGLLTPVAGPVIVDGGAGGASLIVDGSGSSGAASYTVTSSSITRSSPVGFGGVSYSNLNTLQLATGSGPDTVTVLSTSVPTTIDANADIDTLILSPTNSVTVFEQAGNYAFDLGNPGDLIAVDFENIVLLPGNGVLNILGDEGQGTNVGGAGVDEADRVEVFGSARNAGALRLAHLGSFVANPSVVQFTGVTTLNISTFDRDDDITIDPFASTTQAWNIALNVDSGSGDDDLVYGNASAIAVVDPVPNGSVAGVSENVTVTPTLIAGTGEIAVPGVVTIHFANTEDLSFLFNTGVSGDSDTLTMRSLDANASDVFTIRPDAAANDAEPVVDFDVNATQNLQLERVVQVSPGGASSPVSSLSFVGLSASDAFDLIPSANGTVLNIDGGNPTVNPLASDIVVVAAPANPNNLVAFQVGATNDQGTFLSNLAGTPRAMVNFARVEGLTINNGSNTSLLGSNSDNAISLVGTSANTLSAAIDAGSTILVNSVSTLNVNSLAGDDKIELTLGLLAINSISISGGAPTASDTIVLNGTGASDTIVVDQLTQDGGRVTGLGTPVTVATTEKLILNGVGGVDRLTLQTPANRQLISVTPGSTADQAYVSMRNLATNGGGSLLPIEYRNLGLDTFGTAQLSFSDISGNRVDDLTIEGLSTSDNFSVDSNGNVFLDSEAVAGSLQRLVKVATPGISSLNLHGHDGDDDFFVPGNHPFTAGISLDGGNPSASDTLIFAGSGGAITMNFASSTISETGFGPITTVGVEHVNISASAGNVNIAATTGNDLVEVIPGSNTATVRLLGSVPGIGSPPEVNASQIGTLNIDLGAGLDALTVKGSTGADSIAVTGTSVTIGLFEAVNFTGAEALSVLGQQGTDTFTVTPGTFPIFIDGGDPIGIDPGDSMTVSGGLGFFPGPESDEGGIPTAGGTISFDHLEQVAISSVAGCAFLLQGTNGDDDITVTAIDSTTTAGADGIQDFTVSLNADLSIFVLNQPDLYIDSMSGDDDIVIRAGAPNGADWDVYVRIAGGSPSIGAPLEADRLVLETPNQLAGFDNLVFTPTGSDTATLIIDENASGTYEAAGTDSQIAIGSFVFSCTMASYTYTSTAGGVELIQYNGEGAPGIDDNILINGTALDDTTIVNPTGIGSGTFTSEASPLFQFQSFDNLTVNPGTGGFDRVEINATAGADVVTSNASTIMLGGAVTLGQGIDQLDINTFDGNDNVDLNLQLTGLRKVIRLGEGDDIADLAGVIADSSDPLIYGGDGDDSIVGSPNIDNIYGGSGTDVILGLAGNDYIDGGDGNDTLTGGPGNDMLHGGSGGDVIIWNNGDNTDVVEGGTGDDLAVVNGAGAGDTFTVFANVANPSRLAVNRTNLIAFSLDIGDVEELDINSGSGADNVTVGDLSTTALRDLDLDLGVEAGVADTATVNGRTTADNIQMTGASNTMTIAGLRYDVRIINALASDNDDFTFNANAGDDQVVAADSVAAFFASSDVLANNRFRILGGDGNDNLSGYGLLGGQAGDDLLVGSLSIAAAGGNQVLQGGDGDDTMVGGTGNDTFDGGPGEDTILVRGTPGNDNIDIFQAAAATLIETVNGVSETDTLVLLAGVRTVERVLVQAGDGNDTVRVQWADSLGVDGQINSLFVQVDGGPGATGDRLGVVDLGVGDLLLLEQGNTSDKGTITVGPGNAEPLVAAYINVETSQPIPAAGGDVVVFKHDPFEFNNLRTSATYLGANSSINVDPTINPGLDPVFGFPADEDWYRVVAEKTGVLDFQVYFRQVVVLPSGRPGLPGGGNLEISVTDAAGNIISGFGANDATSDERFRIPAVQGQTYFLRVFANGASVNVYDITVMNYAPPVVRDIELLDNPVGDGLNSDTGRSQFDNTTRDNTPTLVFRLDDGILLNDIQGNSPSGNNPPNGVVIPIPFQASADLAGYRIAIFDEGSSPAPGTQVGTAPQVPLGFATFVSPGVYQFTVPNALSDGSHFLTARVQIVDPSNPQQTGFGERSVPLEIVVDTVVPLGFFGENSLGDTTQGLAAASDSGVVGVPFTFTDRVTNDTTPTFYGISEANTIVRLYVETNGVPGLQTSGASTDLFLGLTVAVPLDGSNQAPGGQWFFTTPLDLNNPTLGFTKDGLRSVYVTSEDLAGNTTPDASADKLNIFLDTAGAQVTDVKVTGSPLFNLFGLKPDNATEGPTPRVDGLTIQIQDFPNRSNVDPNFLYAALQQSVAETPGNFVLQGDQSGIIAIKAIRFIGNPAINGQRASGRIELDFYAPLPDDRFTLTIKDTVVDPVGNKLDGESNAAEPNGQPNFASGDGQPGRDFIARFTVDSRPEIGTVSQGLVYVDINGNFDWDPTGSDNDATNRDFVMQMGTITDAHFAGNFAPAGAAAASGYDKLGVYGSFNGIYSFLIDTNDDGVGDFSSAMPPAYQVNGIPVAGNFSAAHPGDEIGLFTGTFWYLDFNGNNQIDLGERIASNFNGLPVVGNFDNDPEDELATYDNATNTFHFDLNRDGIRDVSWDVRDTLLRFGGLSGFTDRPVAGDLNLDGIDDLGLWVKGRAGQLPSNAGEFFFWVSDRVAASPLNVFDAFSPEPLGNDLFAQFGDENALPIFGNFDPPVGAPALPPVAVNYLHNLNNPLDVNRDGGVSPLDVLLIVNALNSDEDLSLGQSIRSAAGFDYRKLDTNDSGFVSAVDALVIINQINRQRLAGEGEVGAEGLSANYAAQADAYLAQFNIEEMQLAKRRSRR